MIDVYLVTDSGAKTVSAEELPDLLQDPDALVWVDIPRCDPTVATTLSEVFGFHDIAIRDCVERNHISKLHVYDDHVFTVLHAPQIGPHGHVHHVEIDQFLGTNLTFAVNAARSSPAQDFDDGGVTRIGLPPDASIGDGADRRWCSISRDTDTGGAPWNMGRSARPRGW